jgi:pullulanase/glycogen debranching enzyme
MQAWPGKPFPLGPEWDGSGTNFSLFSENAERVELCLFDGDDEETRIELLEREAFNWHCYLPGVGPGQRYGYRVYGAYDPASGRRPTTMPTCTSTTRTTPRRFRSASSSTRTSTGATTSVPRIRGTRW